MTFLQAGQDLRIGGRQSNAQYQYTIQSETCRPREMGPDCVARNAEAARLHGCKQRPAKRAGLQASLTYDRQTAARLGLSAQLIDQTLYDAFGQRQVSTMFTSLNQYHVVMEVDPQFWQSPAGLETIYMRQLPPSTTNPTSAASASPASIAGSASAGTVSTAQAAPGSTPLPIPTVTSPQPSAGPIAAPTPVYPFSTSQVTPAPMPTPAASSTPSANTAVIFPSTLPSSSTTSATPRSPVATTLSSTPILFSHSESNSGVVRCSCRVRSSLNRFCHGSRQWRRVATDSDTFAGSHPLSAVANTNRPRRPSRSITGQFPR